MPKTVHINGTALRMFADMAGLSLPEDDFSPAAGLLADVLGAEVIGEIRDEPSAQQVADDVGLTERLTSPNLSGWMTSARHAHGCAKPVRLAGTSTTVNTATGEVVEHFDTSTMPDGVIYKACGNRREAACPACSRVYKYDTYQLIKAGMAGGKGVPESVTNHPALFVTITAPSFGPVHARVQKKKDGPVTACRPYFRDKPVCKHGRPLYCATKHRADDPRIGTPLCLDCYDHLGHVIWNYFAPKLWAKTTIDWSRALTKVADAHGELVKIRFVKVGEFQHRGLVHFHALLRLDGYDPQRPGEILPPPACITAAMFQQVITKAITDASTTTPAHPDIKTSWLVKWGTQVDARIIRTGLAEEHLTEGHVAGYLAKYATKGTEATGVTLRRLTGSTVKHYAHPAGNHTARLIDAAWTLGRPDPQLNDDGEYEPGPFEGLRRAAHQYGFAGHFSTKSQRYSTTLGRLRAARRIATVRGTNPAAATVIDLSDDHNDAATVTLADWSYEGSGWLTLADAALAMQAAAAARERKPANLTHQP